MIPFSVSNAGYVNLSIYNICGQNIRTLVDSWFSPGMHTVTWDGLADNGLAVSAGIYLYRLTHAGQAHTGKMMLLDGGSHAVSSPRSSAAGPVQIAKTAVMSYAVTLFGSHIETRQVAGLNPEDNGIYDFIVKPLGNNMTENMIYLTIGDMVLEATLADNSSADALKELLADGPVTIAMRDYGNMGRSISSGPRGRCIMPDSSRGWASAGTCSFRAVDSVHRN